MIGHWLLQLSREQEDRVLTTQMGTGALGTTFGNAPCILGAAGMRRYNDKGFPSFQWLKGDAQYLHRGRLRFAYNAVWHSYDRAYVRFGVPRVAAAIRNRILSNRAWRALARQERELVGARA